MFTATLACNSKNLSICCASFAAVQKQYENMARTNASERHSVKGYALLTPFSRLAQCLANNPF